MKPTLTFLTVLLLAPLTTVPAVGAPKQNRNAAQAADRKPNLLIVHADDLGYGDVQCYNPDRGRIPTPHLDKLAAEGQVGISIGGPNPIVEKDFNVAGLHIRPDGITAWDNDVLHSKGSPEAGELKARGTWNRKFFYATTLP